MPDSGDDHTPEKLRRLVRATLDSAWVDLGYTAPNLDVYPWLWLWDSCFHAILWAELGVPERALRELESVLAAQDSSGFVPHMGYQRDPDRSSEIWGRRGSSSITQPPIYGHAVAELVRRGITVPESLVEKAALGLEFLLKHRRRRLDGLITVVHPWESGCDDSPRWDDMCPGDEFELHRWRDKKMDLLPGIERGPVGEPISNPQFDVAPVSFNALIAWNVRELATVGSDHLVAEADELAQAIDTRWLPEELTWIDSGATSRGSGRTRTVEALLPLLVSENMKARSAATASLVDPAAHGSRFGPLGVHRQEPSFSPDQYWRGPVWPQLAYLLWVATSKSGIKGESDIASVVRTGTVAGAAESGMAEYWVGDSGVGLGAIPQSWSGLPLAMRAD